MPRINGFTLVQLLITLAIASVLSGIALPNFSQLYAQHQATTAANELLSQLRFARTHALSQGRYVSVCAIGEQDKCGTNWARGLYAFYDDDSDGEIATADDIIRIFPRNQPNAALSLKSFPANANFINYTPLGTSMRKYSSGNLVYCPRAGQHTLGRVVIYSASGRAYLGRDKNHNGIPENGSDKDIVC
ncbi:GspH/FimT family pseudopilin [Halioxenophilus aromaticivorans]|uniref:Type II secretion system protein H n=1 Tax=Halioxenophilus aromaticivorans TaxID=1306992 RepID=A0AAV3U7I7_9ALTE